MTFTLDVLQRPLYDPAYPSALNFGLIGSLIGHEIGHAFDTYGIQFDQFGQLSAWFNVSDDYKKYNETITCLKNQYQAFCPGSDTDPTACRISGTFTINENLAGEDPTLDNLKCVVV